MLWNRKVVLTVKTVTYVEETKRAIGNNIFLKMKGINPLLRKYMYCQNAICDVKLRHQRKYFIK